ncbi:polysaccharide deacetylase family protein [Pseudarthrobacter sp. O4]|uniref:polysaccharide deacetylase family protein n=1 Tax=Pseudarthrobacter sp. O4 TaxID=3418417 RepID=UPI003CF637B6
MRSNRPPGLPVFRPDAPGRRAALGLLGASLVAAVGACAAPERSGQPDTSTASDAGTPAPGPAGIKRLRRSFIPDFTLPPVHGGLVPVLTRIPTKHPVVFLTIDDGAVRTPEMVRLMAAYDYPASLFLARTFVQEDPGFFQQFAAQGSLVENHTLSHNINMVRQSGYPQQLADIAGMQDYAEQQFGRRPTLFRPPGGAYSDAMRQAVAAAGLKAIVTWEAKANAGRMDYQHGNSLRPGDIVLMHFRQEFAADLAAFRAAQLAAGLEVVLLESFLGVA